MELTLEELEVIKTVEKLEECFGKESVFLRYIPESGRIGVVCHRLEDNHVVVLKDFTNCGIKPIFVKEKIIESLWKKKLIVHYGKDHVPVSSKAMCKNEYLGVRIRVEVVKGLLKMKEKENVDVCTYLLQHHYDIKRSVEEESRRIFHQQKKEERKENKTCM